jgi:hypothetical protein
MRRHPGPDLHCDVTCRGSDAARVATVIGAVVLLAACSSSHSAEENSKAKELVAATRSAGVASGLTVDAAEALYGTSAPQLCDALDGGVSSAEQLLLTGNLTGRRDKVITADGVTYGRLVVETYCPGELSTYDDLVDDIDATKVTR